MISQIASTTTLNSAWGQPDLRFGKRWLYRLQQPGGLRLPGQAVGSIQRQFQCQQ
jgi:hypothetical protein